MTACHPFFETPLSYTSLNVFFTTVMNRIMMNLLESLNQEGAAIVDDKAAERLQIGLQFSARLAADLMTFPSPDLPQ